MKHCIVLGCAILLSLGNLRAATSLGRGPVRAHAALDYDLPNSQNRVHRIGNVWMNITNFGLFGNDGFGSGEDMADPCSPGEWAPQCEFPAGSRQQYLFQAGLWVGALVEENGVEIPRVSTGTDGWMSLSIREFWPGPYASNGIVERSNLESMTDCYNNFVYDPEAGANEEYVAVYSDTLADPNFITVDTTDGPHHPLGIEVRQVSRSWQSTDFGDFILFDYRLRNIGSQVLKNVYVGLYVDADVGLSDEFDHHTDDIAGFVANDVRVGPGGDTTVVPVNIAWIADNDGRPPQMSSGPLTVPHVGGTYVLVPPDQQTKFSFNWWVSNQDIVLDYGPSWAAYADSDSVGMGWTKLWGTPLGDLRKYQLMSNGEMDFWQIMVDRMSEVPPQIYQDPFTHQVHVEPWSVSDPSPDADDVAYGCDARYLLSWGPLGTFDHNDANGQPVKLLNPGQEITLSFAQVMGRNFHNPAHPQPGNNRLDSTLFDLSGLLQTARAARYVYDHAATHQPPVAPAGFGPLASSSQRVDLTWRRPQFGHPRGYNVYGINRSDSGSQQQLNTTLVSDTFFTINGLHDGDDWLIRVQTVDDSGWTSAYLDTLIRVAAPFPVRALGGECAGAAVWLHWTANTEPDLAGYRVYCYDPVQRATHFFETTRARYTDESVTPGREYIYWVTARDNQNLESLIADSVTLRPVHPAHRILLIDETFNATTIERIGYGGIADSLVDSTYSHILNGLGEPFDRIVQSRLDSLQFSVEQLLQYDLVIWHAEDNEIYQRRQQFLVQAREDTLRAYLNAGGRLLRFARKFAYDKLDMFGWLDSITPPISWLSPLRFAYYYPTRYQPPPVPADSLAVHFVGANPEQTGFPAVHIDTARVNALLWHNQHMPYLPEIDRMEIQPPAQVLYRAVDLEGDTMRGNKPCAVMGYGEILAAFPLYFLRESDARALMQACISTLRAVDTTPLQLSLGVVQNPVETSDLDPYLVANRPLSPAPCLNIWGMTYSDSVQVNPANGTVYHADYRLTASGFLSLTVTALDAVGHSASARHTFYTHYVLAGGPGLQLSLPDGGATLQLPDGAFAQSGYLLFHSNAGDGTSAASNVLSPQVSIGPGDWTLAHPARLTIRCDAAPSVLQRGVHVSRLMHGTWIPESGELTVSGNAVGVDISQLGTYAVFEGASDLLPRTTMLYPGYPNPFNPSTTIRFDLAAAGNVKLAVYNILGEEVRVLINGPMTAGAHQVRWDGSDDRDRSLSSGVYIVRLQSGQGSHAVKLAMIR